MVLGSEGEVLTLSIETRRGGRKRHHERPFRPIVKSNQAKHVTRSVISTTEQEAEHVISSVLSATEQQSTLCI
jgi:hypothetical protein